MWIIEEEVHGHAKRGEECGMRRKKVCGGGGVGMRRRGGGGGAACHVCARGKSRTRSETDSGERRKSGVAVPVPPDDFDYVAATIGATREILLPRLEEATAADAEAGDGKKKEEEEGNHVDWNALIDRGELVYMRRRLDYVERRNDGYREPEEVVILGTAHTSKRSAKASAELIRALRPDCVVVELCRSRSALVQRQQEQVDAHDGASSMPVQSKALGISGSDGAYQSVMRSVSLGGNAALLLRVLLQRLMDRMGVQDASTGAEFSSAAVAAREIGAEIVLGDRPIEITLKRSWDALRLGEKVSVGAALLGASVVGNVMLPTLEDSAIARAKQNADTVDGNEVREIMKSVSAMWPAVAKPLLHERDLYLAWSLKRSKAVNGKTLVVGIVGKGHLNGIVYCLRTDTGNLRFRDLVGSRDDRKKKPLLLSDPRAALADVGKSLMRDIALIILAEKIFAFFFGASLPRWLTWPF